MLVLHQLLVLRRVRACGDEMKRTVVGESRELALGEGRCLDVASGREQRLGIIVDELHLVRILRESRLEALDRHLCLIAVEVHVCADRVDHRMRRGHFLQRGKLLLGPHEVLCAQQRRHESVMRGDFIVVFFFGQRPVEELDRVSRLAFVTAQQCANEMEIERVGDLATWMAVGTRLRFGDPFIGHRMRAQVIR